MKKFLAISLFTLLFACKQRENHAPNNATPAAFQEKDIVSGMKSYRSGDVVEELYREVMAHDQALTKLDEDIRSLKENGNDSLEKFDEYYANCLNYYSSAEAKIARLGDSVLTRRVLELLASSKAQFEKRTIAHRIVRQNIDTVMNYELERAYTALKIIKTLPVLEKYSKEILPPIAPLQGLDAEYEKLMDRITGASN